MSSFKNLKRLGSNAIDDDTPDSSLCELLSSGLNCEGASVAGSQNLPIRAHRAPRVIPSCKSRHETDNPIARFILISRSCECYSSCNQAYTNLSFHTAIGSFSTIFLDDISYACIDSSSLQFLEISIRFSYRSATKRQHTSRSLYTRAVCVSLGQVA
jgi:hypothetical protein